MHIFILSSTRCEKDSQKTVGGLYIVKCDMDRWMDGQTGANLYAPRLSSKEHKKMGKNLRKNLLPAGFKPVQLLFLYNFTQTWKSSNIRSGETYCKIWTEEFHYEVHGYTLWFFLPPFLLLLTTPEEEAFLKWDLFFNGG